MLRCHPKAGFEARRAGPWIILPPPRKLPPRAEDFPLLNDDLIGIPGGRWRLQTPALVIDLDVLERNIARMADHAARHGIGLRPHAKTHKSAEIAKRQMAAGALGICCAKLGEAEALAAAGVE